MVRTLPLTPTCHFILSFSLCHSPLTGEVLDWPYTGGGGGDASPTPPKDPYSTLQQKYHQHQSDNREKESGASVGNCVPKMCASVRNCVPTMCASVRNRVCTVITTGLPPNQIDHRGKNEI